MDQVNVYIIVFNHAYRRARALKFGTQIGGVIRKIFGYRDIADLTFSDL